MFFFCIFIKMTYYYINITELYVVKQFTKFCTIEGDLMDGGTLLYDKILV